MHKPRKSCRCIDIYVYASAYIWELFFFLKSIIVAVVTIFTVELFKNRCLCISILVCNNATTEHTFYVISALCNLMTLLIVSIFLSSFNHNSLLTVSICNLHMHLNYTVSWWWEIFWRMHCAVMQLHIRKWRNCIMWMVLNMMMGWD